MKTWRSRARATAAELRCAALLLATALVAGCASTPDTPPMSDAATAEQAGMVDVRTQVPDLDVDMRYAGANNFTGAPVDGYFAPRCYLLRPVAEALARAEHVARGQGYRLRIYDCYRPARAVRAFMAWIEAPEDPALKARFHPALPKSALTGGYIAPVSGHSRGATIDLTLMRCESGACTPLDMGTDFDFFDPLANTDNPAATQEQRENRHRLRAVMEAAGFRNYPMEWWHYTLAPEPEPRRIHDFPVE